VTSSKRWYWLLLQLAAIGVGIYVGVQLFDAVTR
jgi:hypothetical protein